MSTAESRDEREAGMDVQQMIREAHANAVERGFWKSKNVGEKLALIATEVMEFEDSRDVEEVADIVIRTFDLCGHLDISLPVDFLTYWEPTAASSRVENFALATYGFCASTTQAHRKGNHHAVRMWLSLLVCLCAQFSYGFYGEGELIRAIEEKMKANRYRPHMHGARY